MPPKLPAIAEAGGVVCFPLDSKELTWVAFPSVEIQVGTSGAPRLMWGDVRKASFWMFIPRGHQEEREGLKDKQWLSRGTGQKAEVRSNGNPAGTKT